MVKPTGVNLDSFMERFAQLEQNTTALNDRAHMLEVMLEDANRLVKFHLTKEKIVIEERDGLLVIVKRLQQTLQEQCNLRVENDGLKKDMAHLKQQSKRAAEAGEAEVQRLLSETRADGERHKRALEAALLESRRAAEDAQRQGSSQMEAKDAEVKRLLESKDDEVEEMKRRLKEQERERQSELLKVQMEFGAKLARVQSTSQWNQQQQGSGLLPPSVYKRKLQFFQEEKNKEIVSLRQRIKDLEESQRVTGVSERLKKRRR
ncbi:coiled-coil domain-containing protein 152 [Brachionichthys hirsutus]|uniref:coiled-coil domain-containing protein 152 n=1 Tax=Brachionichthys hirsutus TaxID=412623 RepID=UPI00360456CA